MSTNSEWPKSFRFKHDHSDTISFDKEGSIARCRYGLEWTLGEAVECCAWEPIATAQPNPAPAASQDDVKAEIADRIDFVRNYVTESRRQWNVNGIDAVMLNCIEKLADAVERLAR